MKPWERYQQEQGGRQAAPWQRFGGTGDPELPQEGGVDVFGALKRGVDSLADGATFGLAPHIRAAGRSVIEGEGYGDALETERAMQSERREDYPVSTFINEAGGGMLSAGGLASGGLTATRLAGQGAGRTSRAAAVGVDGAAMGAVQSAAEGENPGIGAAAGFLLGAGTSAGLESVADGVTGALRRSQVARNAPGIDDIRARQAGAYGRFDAEDVALKNDAVNRFISNVEGRFAEMGLPRETNARAYRYLIALRRQATQADGVSMRTLENFRSSILADLRGGGVTGSEQKALGTLRTAIDDMFQSASTADVIAGGNPNAAVRALQDARAATRQLKKAEILEEIFTVPEGKRASGEASHFRMEMRRILREPRTRNMFTKEEQQAMMRVANGGSVEALLRQFGRMGLAVSTGGSNSLGMGLGGVTGASIGTAIGGGPGAVIGGMALPTAASGARMTADSMTIRNARHVQNLVNMTGRMPARSEAQRLLLDERLRGIAGDAATGAVVNIGN